MKTWHWIALGILTGVSVVLELSYPTDAEHHEFWWSSIPLFYMLYGFVGCVLLIVVAKWFGKVLLQKKEDYYDVV